jgi:hypothetical protein
MDMAKLYKFIWNIFVSRVLKEKQRNSYVYSSIYIYN